MENLDELAERLRGFDFSEDEVAYYLKLSAAGWCSCPERLRMLMDKRKETLDEIHRLEGQIFSMDTMRHEIRKHILRRY